MAGSLNFPTLHKCIDFNFRASKEQPKMSFPGQKGKESIVASYDIALQRISLPKLVGCGLEEKGGQERGEI